MNRRGFLGTLLASVGALAIDPATLLWQPPAVTDGLPALTPEALVGLNRITMELAREIAKHWQGRELVSAQCIGQEGLSHQFNVAMEFPPTSVDQYGLDAERYIAPMARAFAQRLNQCQATRCGALPLPVAVDHACIASPPKTGLCVRGVTQYDPGFLTGYERRLLRFDVVCG